MSKDLVVVSNNKGKILEFKHILKDFNVLSLADLNIDLEIVEDGKTFRENAIKKVNALGLEYEYVIADDSGLEIEALDNKPGVYSARFLGEEKAYEIKNLEVIDLLKDKENRKAKFTSVIAFREKGEIKIFEGEINGEIAHIPKGNGGFGYDPIFYVSKYNMTFSEMDENLKNKISHRANALKKLMEYLNYA